jgi:hypothetical protein
MYAKCWMNKYWRIYKTKMLTSLVIYSLRANHITSSRALKLSIQNNTPTYTKVASQSNKRQTSSQLQVGKWMKLLNCPQNMTCYKTWYMCLQGTHFPCRPNESDIIATKSKQMQIGKFVIVTSYYFLFGFWPYRISYIRPYLGRGTSNGGFTIVSRSWPAFHWL